ncbi:MAG: hypothetical protein ACR2KV_12275 [Solirubrobacteraceae bacterium]
MITSGTAAAQGGCDTLVSAATQSPPNESCGFGTDTLNDIRAGDASELLVTSDPPAFLDLRVNLDAPITCSYLTRTYQGLSDDQYNVIVNNGSTVNEPTLHITLSTAVPVALAGAQLIIYRGKAQVCFGSPRPFTPRPGSPLRTTNDPGIGVQYVALLPDCSSLASRGRVGPCITRRTASLLPTPTGSTGVVNVFLDAPPGFDPRIHD